VSDVVYCIDTSSLINFRAWRSPKGHPGVWKKLDTLIKEKRLIAPWKVFEELKHHVSYPAGVCWPPSVV
jgi:hypothetical protein